MNLVLLAAALVIAMWGCVEIVWAVRADLPRHLVAQGMFSVELGLALGVQALLQPGVMRTSLVSALSLSAMVSAAIQFKLIRAEQRKDSAQAEESTQE